MADVAVGLLVPVLILDVTVGRDGQVFDIELGVATSSDEFFPFQIWGWSGTSRYSDEYEDERWPIGGQLSMTVLMRSTSGR